MAKKIINPERPGGFRDFLPAEYLAREEMMDKIEKTFKLFGFNPIETPEVEFLKTLSGEESDTGKNIFHIKGRDENETLALRFDHTVPLARILASNPYNPKSKSGIKLPWKRMVRGVVFRGETPQNGRYRQFYQMDADIAGTSSMLADAEIINLMYRSLKELGLKNFVIKINNRKILNGLAELTEIKDKKENTIKEMFRILDKLDKIGIEKVLKELKGAPVNLSSKGALKIKEYIYN